MAKPFQPCGLAGMMRQTASKARYRTQYSSFVIAGRSLTAQWSLEPRPRIAQLPATPGSALDSAVFV